MKEKLRKIVRFMMKLFLFVVLLIPVYFIGKFIIENILIILVLYLVFMVIGLFVVLFTWLFAKRIPKDTVFAMTGSLGQGKSLVGVNTSVKALRKNRLLWCFGFMNDEEIPLLYSNIPIRFKNNIIIRLLAKKKGHNLPKYQMSVYLTYEMLLGFERLNEFSILFIDELGGFADQYSYDNPFVVQYLQWFVRYFRHFLDGRFIYTDQASDNVTKPVRVRTGLIHNLQGFHRFWLHFYKVDVLDFQMSEDGTTIDSSRLDDPPYFFGHLPFKYFKLLDLTRFFTYKKYESRCYKPLYDHVKHFAINYFDDNTLYTKYVIDLPNNTEMRKQFKKDGYISHADMLKYVNEWKKNTHNIGQTES